MLESMVRPKADSKPVTSLQAMTLVENFLTDPSLPALKNGHLFAINTILCDIIQRELHYHREMLHLQPVPQDAPRQNCQQFFEEDAQSDSTSLMLWSFLHYHYVRVEVGLSLQDLADLYPCTIRQMQRHRDAAIRLLTDKLVQYEWQARLDQHRRVLISQLPGSLSRSLLYGRDNILSSTFKYLSKQPAGTLFVSGLHGCGKTSLAEAVIREQMEVEPPDKLIWIDQPHSIEAIYRIIGHSTRTINTQINLPDWLQIHRTIVVLDGLTHIRDQTAEIEALLQLLEFAQVWLIDTVYIPLKGTIRYISLPPLDKTNSLAVIHQAYANTERPVDDALSQSDIETIIRVAGGNPGALILITRNLLIDRALPAKDVTVDLFDQIYHKLSPQEQRVWVSLLLYPTNLHATFDEVHRIWPQLTLPALSKLVRRHLIVMSSHHIVNITLPVIVKNYLLQIYAQNAELQDHIQANLALLTNNTHIHTHIAIEIALYVLDEPWLTLDTTFYKQWSKLLVSLDLQGCNPATLYELCNHLEKHVDAQDYLAFQIVKARTTRKLAKWDEASKLLSAIITYAGEEGEFLYQGIGLLETGVMLRSQGYYSSAMVYLTKAEAIFELQSQRQADHTKYWQDILYTEFAQIKIDLRQPEQALDYLDRLKAEHVIQHITLKAEAHLLFDDADTCLNHLRRAIEQGNHTRLQHAQIHDLQGRAYIALHDYTQAHHHFSVAMTYFKTVNSPLMQARCQANLAVSLIFLGQYLEAEQLLLSTVRLQKQLRDQLGLRVTRRNLKLLGGLRSEG